MDINVDAAATLPSGDGLGVVYYIGSTNATGTAPTLSTYYFLSNPGSFVVTGTVVAATQVVFNDTPAQLAFATDRLSELSFDYNPISQAVLAPGANFRCTLFDGMTLIGSATSTVDANGSGSTVECDAVYPDNYFGINGAGAGHADINLPATYNAGDVYTYIISH
jgi:hypothetical protein